MLQLLFFCSALHGALCTAFLGGFTLLHCLLVPFDCPLTAHFVSVFSGLQPFFRPFLGSLLCLLLCLLQGRFCLALGFLLSFSTASKALLEEFLSMLSFDFPLSTFLVALHGLLVLHLLFFCSALHGELRSMFLSGFTLLQCFLVLCQLFTALFQCLLMALALTFHRLHLFLTQRSLLLGSLTFHGLHFFL